MKSLWLKKQDLWVYECPSLPPYTASANGRWCGPEIFMSFGIYIVGALIVIGGLIYGAVLLHVPAHWIVVGGIVLAGTGILMGVKNTRQKDPSS